MNDKLFEWVSTFTLPYFAGVYLVKTITYEQRFSYFDGQHWRGQYKDAGEAWRMRGGPIVQDLYQWCDWRACMFNKLAA